MPEPRLSDVVVVGAGPYGLAVSAHLASTDIRFRTFGKPMGAWRDNMPRGMFLKSKWEATSISGPQKNSGLLDYCNAMGVAAGDERNPIPVDLFVSYGLDFQRRFVGNLEETFITDVKSDHAGFRLKLATGETTLARSVVVASGHVPYAYIPPAFAPLAAGADAVGLVTHASQHADFASFSGQTVAVIGAGQTALESAVLLAEANAKVFLLVRGDRILWGGPPVEGHGMLRRLVKPETPFGPGWSHFLFCRMPELITYLPATARVLCAEKTYGPSGAWWMKKRFGERITALLSSEVVSARSTASQLELQIRSKGREASPLVVDRAVVATGYRVDVDALGFLDFDVRKRIARVEGTGSPQLSRSFESSVPGLYFAGLASAATFGPIERFVYGSGLAAQAITRSILSRGRGYLRSSEAA
jgi:hypothetical protein